ncbi:MAG: hypothetical protein EP330_06665 [Deltaproteobacteria bacterium]|nr:MAG: hypothetical protein EP330_06665 [Deltaproteobacteria bacterium]
MSRRLHGAVVPVSGLSSQDRDAMFTLFATYYADVTRARFDMDLAAKDDVIVLRDERGLQGFSTLKCLRIEHEGRAHYGVFSGDTVVHEDHWGTKVLGKVFLRYLFVQRLKRPWAPLWWFLISKGYKTYLLMANNFPEHWPRYEQPTPATRQALLDAFASQAFPECYDASTGLIRFPAESGRLKQGVAPATEALIAENPRIAFFIDKNAEWADGVELACIASMSWSMPVRYALKHLRDRLRPVAAPTPARST